jgi:transcription elongation factor GreA
LLRPRLLGDAAKMGFETIMVNCNPETVSTDYDTADRLYFEPLTLEDVLNIYDMEQPEGVIVQFGGQTPLKLALGLEANGVPIIGTSPDMIDAAEDRERFQKLLHDLGLRQPPNATARTEAEALEKAAALGYPLVVRPSYVLGGRAMEIVHEQRDLERYMREAVKVSNDSPVLLDRFLNDAIECDVDCLRDPSGRTFIGGVMEHIEQAGVHSGDSACSLPPYSLSADTVAELKRQSAAMAGALNVVGLMNVQFAIQQIDGQDVIYVLEVNPRASRTVPYVSKATGIQLAKVAARCMAGQTLAEQGITQEVTPPYFSVKEAVFPFVKFPGVDTILGPEMKSTGEVMGVGKTFGEAFVKSQIGAGTKLPRPFKADGTPTGKVFLTVKNGDKTPRRRGGPPAGGAGLRSGGHPRHRRRHCRRRRAGQGGQQGHRRPPAHRGHDQERRNRAGHQHRGRAPQRHRRLAPDPHFGPAGPRDHLHHHRRRRSRGGGHEVRGPAGRDFRAGHARPTGRLSPSRGIIRPHEPAGRQRPAVCFWRTTPMATIPITKRGVEKLKAELHDLKTVQRPWVINAIAEARAQGDLSENAEYDAAKDRQGFIEGRIRELEGKLSAAQIIDPAALDAGGKVVFGATVELEDEDSGDTVRYQIVGEDEADLKLGLINISSPIARALIGKEEGDTAEVQAPGGLRRYEIIGVSYV